MGDKDVVSKEAVRRIAIDLATYLLGLDIDPDSLEVLETETRRIEDRRADLVARLRNRAGEASILHIEIQNNNETVMPLRMLRYRADLEFAHRGTPVRQYLIYIGADPLRMADGLDKPGLRYRYELIDMHQVDCETLLAQDNPDALVLAVLCDFRGRDPQAVVNHIVGRLYALVGDRPNRFREYVDMLEVLSDNRDLKNEIKEAEKMLTQIDIERMPSYELGMEKGESAGEKRFLLRLLRGKFGEPSPEVLQRIEAAGTDQLEQWGERILSANSMEEVFAE